MALPVMPIAPMARSYRTFSRTSKRGSSRLALPKTPSPCGNALAFPVRGCPRRRPRAGRFRGAAVRRWRRRGSSWAWRWLVSVQGIVGAPHGRDGFTGDAHRAHGALLQELFEDLEAQVVAFGDAEALVAVRERLVFAGAAVAAALVEGDQFVADVDHGHAHVGQPPVVAHDAFALRQQRLADAAALQPGHDGEHAEVAVSVLFGHVRAGQDRKITRLN